MSQHQAKTIPINYYNSQFSDPHNVCIEFAFPNSQNHLILWLLVPNHSGSMQNICFRIPICNIMASVVLLLPQIWLLLPM